MEAELGLNGTEGVDLNTALGLKELSRVCARTIALFYIYISFDIARDAVCQTDKLHEALQFLLVITCGQPVKCCSVWRQIMLLTLVR